MNEVKGYFRKASPYGSVWIVRIEDEAAMRAVNLNSMSGWSVEHAVHNFNERLACAGYRITEDFRGGTTAVMETPLSSFPVLVRAGSILPLSSGACSTADLKTPADELVIFSGADGSFVLYDDEGDGMGYQDGAYLSIPLRWEEEKNSLFFGNAEGTMPAGTVFQVRLIRPDGRTKTAGIRYTGTEAVLRF